MKRILLSLIVLALLTPTAHAAAPPHVVVNGFRVQFRGVHTHSLYGCERLPVKHAHIDLFLLNGRRGVKTFELHIGAYRLNGRLCWLAYQSVMPKKCTNPCRQGGPGNGLRIVVHDTVRALVQATRIVLVGVSIVIIVNILVGMAAPVLVGI